MTVDVTDSPTAPLTRLTEAQAPPPYAEAMDTSYYQQETQPLQDQQGVRKDICIIHGVVKPLEEQPGYVKTLV